MAANPNNLHYFLRGGTVLPTYATGNVNGTADCQYFRRGGTVMFGAAILPWYFNQEFMGSSNFGQAVPRSNSF